MMIFPAWRWINLKAFAIVVLAGGICLSLLLFQLPMAQAKRQLKTARQNKAEQPVLAQTNQFIGDDTIDVEPTKPKKRASKKRQPVEAQVASFELEPPANPDYPAQLCGKRRERLLELQTMPWIVKPFFLGERRVEQWQYRLCLTKTMPEVQRYLESFPVPYTLEKP